MKKLAIAGLLVWLTLTGRAQTSDTKYYQNSSRTEEVPIEKAKFSKTVTKNLDGSITTEWKNLKKNRIESRQIWKGDEPMGVWIYLTGHGPAEMEYDFSLEYANKDCPKNLDISNYFSDEPSLGYESPKITTGEQFYSYIAKNLVYPAKARREGIQGKVDLIFDLTKDGLIENIQVRNGVHTVLDKEAVRVLRKMRLVSPPKVNGQPQTLCATASISFRLG